jgi:hypothetical protein
MQGASLVNCIVRRVKPVLGLADFHVHQKVIWVLSLSLAGIVLCRKFGIVPVEIAAWNVLTACAILYLAQGIGIVSFFLAHVALPPGLRIGINILIVFMIFSLVFNVILVGAVVVLGIAENWVPLRVSRANGPSSTPGKGD